MFLVDQKKEKIKLQKKLQSTLEKSLKIKRTRNITFPSGNEIIQIHTRGTGEIWAGFLAPDPDDTTPRFWNSFGVYVPGSSSLSVKVEINIPTESNTASVAGFFAEDRDTGRTFLLHSGKIGGGRPGIGKTAFLVWSWLKLVEVRMPSGAVRKGIVVADLDEPDLAGRLWSFVQHVDQFKAAAAGGSLQTPAFEQRIEQYRREFSGKKSGNRSSEFEFVTYHGDIVHALCQERDNACKPGEVVSNSRLIDLMVSRAGQLLEIYEVKTGTGRQSLYTAIGQLMTHAGGINHGIKKTLVVPHDEAIPSDIATALQDLQIQLRHFKIRTSHGKTRVSLL